MYHNIHTCGDVHKTNRLLGVMACPYILTEDGLEMHMATNHFGHFLFFQLLRPTLLASSTASFNSRVVNLSSSGHDASGIRFDDMHFSKDDYNPMVAYGQSKTANIHMANSIERRFGGQGLHAHSLHPGVVFGTDIPRHFTPEQLGGLTGFFDERMIKSIPQGAATSVWAAIGPELEGKGGWYLSDIGVASPLRQDDKMGGGGYAKHAYDEEAEERFWKISNEVVGISE